MSIPTNEQGQTLEERITELAEFMPIEVAADVAKCEFGLDPSDTPIDDNDATNDNQGQEAARE